MIRDYIYIVKVLVHRIKIGTDELTLHNLTNYRNFIMATYGYIFDSATDSTLQMMTEIGCCRIFRDSSDNGGFRPQRRILVQKLQAGDIIVVPRLSHIVEGCVNLSALLQLCHLKNLRLISVDEHIDTEDRLYRKESENNLLKAIREFPFEKRKPRSAPAPEIDKEERLRRNERVINMYLSGFSTEDIQRVAGVGKSTLYRILRQNGIPRQRIGKQAIISG